MDLPCGIDVRSSMGEGLHRSDRHMAATCTPVARFRSIVHTGYIISSRSGSSNARCCISSVDLNQDRRKVFTSRSQRQQFLAKFERFPVKSGDALLLLKKLYHVS